MVIPAEVRKRLSLTPGTELKLVIEGFTVRLMREVEGPELAERGGRLVARPRAAKADRTDIDVAKLVEEERERWPV